MPDLCESFSFNLICWCPKVETPLFVVIAVFQSLNPPPPLKLSTHCCESTRSTTLLIGRFQRGSHEGIWRDGSFRAKISEDGEDGGFSAGEGSKPSEEAAMEFSEGLGQIWGKRKVGRVFRPIFTPTVLYMQTCCY